MCSEHEKDKFKKFADLFTEAESLEKYGGISGWHKHNVEERPLLEKEGWRFAPDISFFRVNSRRETI